MKTRIGSIAGCLMFVVFVAGRAQARSCHAHTHAHDTSGASTRIDNDSGVVIVSCDAKSDVPGAHSHAWATAGGGLFNVSKGAGGHVNWHNGNSPKHAWYHASVGTGPVIIQGPPGFAELRVLIPSSLAVTNPSPGGEPEDVSQGLLTDDLDVFLGVDVSVDSGIGPTSLFSGTATLSGPGAAAPLVETGDLVGAFILSGGTANSAIPPRLAASAVYSNCFSLHRDAFSQTQGPTPNGFL